MNSNPKNPGQPQADEVDLGTFFQLIGNGFRQIFRGFLRAFLFVRRNLAWLVSLVVLGVLLGILLKFFVREEQKLDVIVSPMIDNTEYLNNVVSEIKANIKAKDTAFFASLGMDMTKMKGFDIELTALRTKVADSRPQDLDFMELLTEFGQSQAAEEIIRAELKERTTRDQLITFYFKDPKTGADYAKKLMEYINSNEFYQKLNSVSRKNANERLLQNDSLLAQIDVLIQRYTDQIAEKGNQREGRLVLESQEPLDVPSLFEMKNQLIRDSESKRLELIQREEAIRVLNFGKPQKVQKPIFGNWLVLLPLTFVGLFLLVAFLRHLNRKASELQETEA